MPSTIPLARTIAYANSFNRLQPITGVGSNGNFPLEYALSSADWTKQFITSPPFAWNWNRKQITFPVGRASQDYQLGNLQDFGWFERASISDPNNPGWVKELTVRLVLGENSKFNEPEMIAPVFDDDNGNVTFRLFPLPDKPYVCTVNYQKMVPLFASLNDFWTPIPDKLSYLYNQGFLSQVYQQINDERFALTQQVFFRQVIAANAGLDETQVNLWMDERIDTQREIQARLGNSQSGRAARGMFQG